MSNRSTTQLTPTDYDRGILHPRIRQLMNGDYYNVGWWGPGVHTPNEAASALVAALLARDPDKANVSAVADIGCGLGIGSAAIAAAYPSAQVVGVNYSQAQVDYAQARYAGPELSFVCADATDLPFEDNSLDRIYCVEAAMHFQTRRAFFDQVIRVLRPGGRLYLTDILCNRSNSVIPQVNVVPDAQAYQKVVQAAGLELTALEDVTKQTVDPFNAHMRSAGHAPIARFFTDMCDAYAIAELRAPDV